MTRLVLHAPLRSIRVVRPTGPEEAVPAETVLDPIGETRLAEAESHRAAAALLARIGSDLDQVHGLIQGRLDDSAAWIVELGLGLAGQVLGREVDAGRYDLAPAVRQCLATAIEGVVDGAIVVFLNPADLSTVMGALDGAAQAARPRTEIRFDVDPSLGRGCCRVETSVGQICHDPADVLREAMERIRTEAPA